VQDVSGLTASVGDNFFGVFSTIMLSSSAGGFPRKKSSEFFLRVKSRLVVPPLPQFVKRFIFPPIVFATASLIALQHTSHQMTPPLRQTWRFSIRRPSQLSFSSRNPPLPPLQLKFLSCLTHLFLTRFDHFPPLFRRVPNVFPPFPFKCDISAHNGLFLRGFSFLLGVLYFPCGPH